LREPTYQKMMQSLNSANHLILVSEKQCVFFYVVMKCLCIMHIKFNFQRDGVSRASCSSFQLMTDINQSSQECLVGILTTQLFLSGK